MGRRYTSVTVLSLILLLVGIPSLQAGWVEDGTAICVSADVLYIPQVIPDGSGGAIITWAVYVSGADDAIYAQRIDQCGNLLWTANGVTVSTISCENEFFPEMIPDGAGGAFIVWDDCQDSDYDVYAQRVDAGGTVQWTAGGVVICTAVGSQEVPHITSDGAGRVIIVWSDSRSGSYDIYAQRVDGAGTVQWTADGVAVCTATGGQYSPRLISDGSGGALITWNDYRGANADIYAQRFDSTGAVQWTADGVAVCTATGSQYTPRLTSDGAGGVIITWFDNRSGNYDIYAQKVDAGGTVQWTADGVAVCTATGNQFTPELISDGAGGAIITWQDYRSGNYDIYAQRVDTGGTVRWTADGVAVCTATGDQGSHKLTSDGTGGALITWYDIRSGNADIYAQRVDAGGTVEWTADGVAICTATDAQYNSVLTSDGAGGAYIAWEDHRMGVVSAIYAQRIVRNGYWGYPSPYVTEVKDVPHDQGGKVTVTWDATRLDRFPHEVITHYSIWRKLSSLGASVLLALGGEAVDLSEIDIRFEGTAFSHIPTGDAAYGWEWVGNMIAANFDEYTYTAATLYDSIGTDTGYHHFLVIAHTEDPFVYWVSESDSGYSVDNLSPAQPQGFAGIQSLAPQGLRLSWLPNSESDLSHYSIHSGDDEFFVPDETNRVGTTTDTVLIDTDWIATDYYFYKMSAVDVHGNAGPEALLRPEDITVETLLQSFAAALIGDWIQVSWTLSETGAGARFHVLRAEGASGTYEELTDPGIASEGLAFVFIDRTSEPGETYRYQIEVEDDKGRRILFETEPVVVPALPLTLYQNHPNPFNPSTVIRYYLPESAHVSLDVYDTSGRIVIRLIDDKQDRGTHAVDWNGCDEHGTSMASGVYFYRLSIGKEAISKKMILLR